VPILRSVRLRRSRTNTSAISLSVARGSTPECRLSPLRHRMPTRSPFRAGWSSNESCPTARRSITRRPREKIARGGPRVCVAPVIRVQVAAQSTGCWRGPISAWRGSAPPSHRIGFIPAGLGGWPDFHANPRTVYRYVVREVSGRWIVASRPEPGSCCSSASMRSPPERRALGVDGC
jgi:hypothetical protein